MRPPLPISVSKALDQLLALLKMSDYEADEYQERLEDRADRRFDPKSRRKIQSMGQRESKPSMHNLPGLNRKTMRDRDLSRNMNRKRAIMGLDLPSYHGFGGDDREIHPGDTSINEGIESGETGKRRLHGDLRVERAVPIESPEDLSRLFTEVGPGIYERNPNPESNLPWTTSGPINYIPQTEEWVDSPFTQTPTFRGTPFNEETGFTKGNSKELKGCPINVGEAFNEAWDVLKALPEQQMFETLRQKGNLGEDDDYWYGGEEEGHDAGDRQRALGTVHPAIYGLLQRESAKRNFPDTHHRMGLNSPSNQETLPNLNLQTAGAQKRFIGANELTANPARLHPSIDGHPELWNQMAQRMVTKMGFPPSNGPPSPSPSPPSKPPNGGGQEEYSHKDLDAESLIDFLIQTLHMDYQDAKVLVTHHKTKELAGASQRKAKVAAEETVDEVSSSPPSPQMGAPPMGMGKPPMGGPI